MFKKTLIALCGAVCVISAVYFLAKNPTAPEKKPPDFSIQGIVTAFPPDARWASEKGLGAEDILRQRFTYLDAGVQSYVFLSEDKQHVLKFFKQGRHSKRPEKREEAFSSYKIAYDHLREETGLVFLHLVPQDGLSITTTLVDHLGREHRIDLGNFEFLLQKRAELIDKALCRLMVEKKEEQALLIIDDLFSFFHHRLDKGILDGDPKIPINLGILDGKIVQIDIGRFSLPNSPAMFQDDLAQFRKKNGEFATWLKKTYPVLYSRYQTQLKLLEQRYDKCSVVL